MRKVGVPTRLPVWPIESWSILSYDPHRVDDTWDIAEERKNNVYPEVLTDSHLQEHPQRGEKNGSHQA